MRDRIITPRHRFGMAAVALLACLAQGIANADVVGRLHITAHNADNEKPIPNSTILLHDPTGVHTDIPLAAIDGSAVTPPLETHAWQITARADGYVDATQTATVVADTTTDIDIDLEAKQEKVIQIHSNTVTTNPTNTTVGNVITPAKLQAFPVASNPTSISQALIMNPGFVPSTGNVIHPRGEHASTTIDFDGIELPGALLGRAGQFFSPEVFQSLDALTGGFAPEYGSEAAAVLNVQLKSGPIQPYMNMDIQGGSYSTLFGDLTMAGQVGDQLESVESGAAPRRLRYFLNLTDRTTDNALESPNQTFQDAHNSGQSQTLFGNFDYTIDSKNTLSIFGSDAPATTEIANRAGLSSSFAPYGQGYGFGGFRDANGNVAPEWDANPGGLGDSTMVLPSQQADGQDIYQVDQNAFGFANLRHTFDDKTTGLFSVGDTMSGGLIKDNNPLPQDLGSLPVDSSEEYNPNVNRTYNQAQVQGSITRSVTHHTYKAGIVFDDQNGTESDQYTPESQLAGDALAAIDTDAKGNFIGRLTPAGHFTGATDALGNPVYAINPGATAPVVTIHKTGYYGAAYVQDTWNISRKFTANYGARLDTYHQQYNLSEVNAANDVSTALTKTVLSPRVNFSYALVPTTVLRASFDHLFTQPPLAQGAVLGNIAVQPETIDQYDVSLQREVAPRQTAKVAYYYKNIRNQDDTGILIPFTQIGSYTTLNYQFASVHGVEFSYDTAPKNDVGVGGYLAAAWSHAAPGGTSSAPPDFTAPTINDHNQYWTASTGVDYTWATKAQVGLDMEYGSGEASSDIGTGTPTPHTIVNFRALSAPRMIGPAALELDVDNVFNSVPVLNFESGFSGTRFAMARTILLSSKLTF